MQSIQVDRSVAVPLRDGVRLSADVWRSTSTEAAPTVLVRTPYGKEWAAPLPMLDPRVVVDHGWNLVVQDVRGRGTSEGLFVPFVNEADDGSDTVNWIRQQPWSDGTVAATGMSYVGATAWLLAQSAPKGLAAIAPVLSAPTFGEGWSFTNGVREHGFLTTWCAANLAKPEDWWLDDPLRATYDVDALADIAPWSHEWLARGPQDSYWRQLSQPHLVPTALPVLHIAGWHDIFCQGTLAGFHARGAVGDRLLIGPWAHDPSLTHLVGDSNVGSAGNALTFGLMDAIMGFFDDAAHGQASRLAPVTVFHIGCDRWDAHPAWPPPQSISLDVELSGCSVTVDPRHPAPSLGGRGLLVQVPGWGYGPRDQSALAARADVVSLPVAGLPDDFSLLGPQSLTLLGASCDVGVPQWVATVCVRRVDGRLDGVLSACRETAEANVTIPLGDAAVRLAAGEALEVLISGGAWPRWQVPRNGTTIQRFHSAVLTLCGTTCAGAQ